MRISTGVDLVHIPTFSQALERGGQVFLDKIFRAEELARTDPVHLAGMLAAKEAIFKALSDQADLTWQRICLKTEINRKPTVTFIPPLTQNLIMDLDISISHEKDYAIASAMVLIQELVADGIKIDKQ